MILAAIVKEIERRGLSRYQVFLDTGVDQGVLHRIFHGGSCSLPTAETLCEYLQLEVTPKARKGR